MRCRKVRKFIDAQPLNQTDGDARLAVLAHCDACVECRQWLQAASIATSLIRARACEETQPSPFFKTRVLAAIREHGGVSARGQLDVWRSAWSIVASMLAVVIVLLALNLFAPRPVEEFAIGGDNSRGRDSIERVMMEDNGGPADENLTSGQVLDTVFAQGDSNGID